MLEHYLYKKNIIIIINEEVPNEINSEENELLKMLII